MVGLIDDRVVADHLLAFHLAYALPETVVLIAMVAYVASFAISLGPVMWYFCPRSSWLKSGPRQFPWLDSGTPGYRQPLLFSDRNSRPGGLRAHFSRADCVAAGCLLFIVMLAPETKWKDTRGLDGILTLPKQALAS